MPHPSLFVRLVFLLTFCGTLLVPSTHVHAQSGVQMTAVPAFDGNYVFGTWLPLTIVIKNNGAAVPSATLAAALPNTTYRNSYELELPAGAEKQVLLYVAMEQETTSIVLTLRQGDTSLAETAVEVRPRNGERLLGVVSDGPLTLNLPRRQDIPRLPFTSFDLPLAALPPQAMGLGSVQLLLLSNAKTQSLAPAQLNALIGWVALGGHLVIGGGDATAVTVAGLPPSLLPATVGEKHSLNPQALGALLGLPGPTTLDGVRLQALPGADTVGEATAPLLVSQPYGKGRVTMLAFDPVAPALTTWASTPRLWDQLLQPSPNANVSQVSEQIMTSAVGYLPPTNVPNANLLFLVLVVYTLLIGPGIALLLRHFDRQAWGWVALPGAALLTSAIAFGIALALRPESRMITEVSLIEQTDDQQAIARTLTGIFAPQQGDHGFNLPVGALSRPLRSVNGLYGPISGAQGGFVQERGTLTAAVERWKLQGVLSEQQIPFAGLTGTFQVSGARMVVEVTNQSDQVIREVVAIYGEQLAHVGDLAPKEQKRVDWPAPLTGDQALPLGSATSYLVLQAALDASRKPGGSPDRQLLTREALLNAATARGPRSNDEGPFLFGWADRSPLSLDLQSGTAAFRQNTLIIARPHIISTGVVTLTQGWLRPDMLADTVSACNGRLGTGIASQPTVTMTLRLPRDLAALTATQLTLDIQSVRHWPNSGVTTRVYNWQRTAWDEVNYDGPGNLTLPQPAAYLRNGVVRLALSGRVAEAQCLYVQASVAGTMP